VTKLVWQLNIPNGPSDKFTWQGAIDYCKTLSIAGGGWRLPTRIELVSLLDPPRENPSIDNTFTNTPAEKFWSSSPSANGVGKAFTVEFFYGSTFTDDASTMTARVRCVR
jgi:hypothetical protein